MPALAIFLSFDYASGQKMIKADKIQTQLGDVVPFISGLLLGGDANIRTWFSVFIKNGQKVLIFLISTISSSLISLNFLI
jgi:integrator complex subunit 2